MTEVVEPGVVLENAADQVADELQAELFRIVADETEVYLRVTCEQDCGHPDNAHGTPWCGPCNMPLDEPCTCVRGVVWRMALRELGEFPYGDDPHRIRPVR